VCDACGGADHPLRLGDEGEVERVAIAFFWTANVIRQYSRVIRDVADTRGLDLLQTARFAAMVTVVGADAGTFQAR
jgi:hypothetical protein